MAAAKLGLIGPGSGRVVVQAITNADIRAGRYPGAPRTASAAPPPEPAPTQPALLTAEPLEPLAPMAPISAAPQAGGIYLQFGAFSSAQNAQALASRVNIEASGLAGTATVSHQPPLYKVRMASICRATKPPGPPRNWRNPSI